MKRICLFLCLILLGRGLFAQNTGSQQSADNSAIEYLQAIGSQSALYYGNQQEGHLRSTNHPYFVDANYVKSRLSYCGVIYPEALLRLDLNRNELIIWSPEFRNIVLFNENVDFVEIHGQYAVYFHSGNLPGSPAAGYYFLIHSGKCEVLKKITATMVEETDSHRMKRYYTFTTRFYLNKDDACYYSIKNRRQLLKALNPHKRALKRFIAANRLTFWDNAEELIIRTVGEYEKISGSL